MAKFYIKLVKRAQRFLRSKFMKKWLPWLIPLMKPLFKREYWLPVPHRMALGLSIGLFFAFAMMIIPLQMICSAFVCMFVRANLPLALGACWISNPFTIPAFIKPMEWLGAYFGQVTGNDYGDAAVSLFDISVNQGDFFAGCVVSGIACAVLTYPIFMISWLLMPTSKPVK